MGLYIVYLILTCVTGRYNVFWNIVGASLENVNACKQKVINFLVSDALVSAFSALTLLVWRQEEHMACKN